MLPRNGALPTLTSNARVLMIFIVGFTVSTIVGAVSFTEYLIHAERALVPG